jgi:1,2-dihydroxy-3-keto-5-methylthiopentene dioxygenase
MAVLRDTANDTIGTDVDEIARRLQRAGITYERWQPRRELPADATPEQLLAAYEPEVVRIKNEGGYTTADVIDLKPETSGLEDMLGKFRSEHWHDEDEVRFIVEGSGVFHINTDEGVLALEVQPGDFVRVPRGTRHWFDLCQDRRIRAIRLFQDRAGWVPQYTGSGVDHDYQPLCLGPSYLPVEEYATGLRHDV